MKSLDEEVKSVEDELKSATLWDLGLRARFVPGGPLLIAIDLGDGRVGSVPLGTEDVRIPVRAIGVAVILSFIEARSERLRQWDERHPGA